MPTSQQDQWLLDTFGFQVPPAADPAEAPAQGAAAPSGGGLGKAVKRVIKPKKPVPRTDLGPTQQARADKLLEAMSPQDRVKVQKLLDDASPMQKKYLTKGLACKHSVAELQAFATEIAGKNTKWMNDNLHLVGESQGKGIKQQWHDSCGPTTVQAMMGELDPLYALKLHKENTDVTKVNEDKGDKLNPKMAAEQKKWLESHDGVAKSRAPDKAAGGEGMVLDGLLSEQTAKIGVKFDIESVEGDAEMTKGLNDAEKALKGGLPVPVRVGGDEGGHFVLMTGIEPGPPRRFSFHDPWDGKTLVFSEKQIKANDINIAGWKKMTHIFKPEAAAP